MTADNDAYYRKLEDRKVELSNHIVSMEYQFLDASILLDRWSKWAKTFGSLVGEQKDFLQLQKDTEEFFNMDKTR
jgi:hypothetical protein